MSNTMLTNAKKAKNDEFYTQYHDIDKEVSVYFAHNADVFRGKTMLLPCDDPEWSNFTKYFVDNFERFGIKKLISTSYSPNGKGKIAINGKQWHYLNGNGDFRSAKIKRLRDEADFIITNPPFSLFREFLAWIVEANKLFLILGNMNAITYKEVFPLIKSDRIWTGNQFGDIAFKVPDSSPPKSTRYWIDETGQKWRSLGNSNWFTNIEHGRRHQPLQLMTMADNLKYSKHKEIKGASGYQTYDNYDAIEVPFTDAIPSDYDGVMGVPISFLDKYCPEQFEIVGCSYDYGRPDFWDKSIDMNVTINGVNIYKRILIRHRKAVS